MCICVNSNLLSEILHLLSPIILKTFRFLKLLFLYALDPSQLVVFQSLGFLGMLCSCLHKWTLKILDSVLTWSLFSTPSSLLCYCPPTSPLPSLYPGQYPARHSFLNTISIILLWLFFVLLLYWDAIFFLLHLAVPIVLLQAFSSPDLLPLSHMDQTTFSRTCFPITLLYLDTDSSGSPYWAGISLRAVNEYCKSLYSQKQKIVN